jgi:hypothetical protein
MPLSDATWKKTTVVKLAQFILFLSFKSENSSKTTTQSNKSAAHVTFLNAISQQNIMAHKITRVSSTQKSKEIGHTSGTAGTSLKWDGGATGPVAAPARTRVGLGTVATLDLGTAANNVVQRDAESWPYRLVSSRKWFKRSGRRDRKGAFPEANPLRLCALCVSNPSAL